MAIDRVILGAREVTSAPLSADFTLLDTSRSPCVSMLMLTGVGVDVGSRNTGPGSGVLKGVFVTISNSLRKEGRIRDLGVATEMDSGVGPEGGVGNSLIRSAVGSSGPICIVSIRAGGAGVLVSNACLSFSSSSLTTSSTMVLTNTSLDAREVLAVCILGEWGGSGLAGVSSSYIGSEAPGWSGFIGVSVVPSFPQSVKLGISPEISGRFSAATGGTSGCSPLKRTLILSKSSSIFSAKSTRTGIPFRL